jgi:hypothetical protein
MMDMLAQVLASVLPLFVTLTYPLFFPLDAEAWKRHKLAFEKRLKRKYPKAGWIWHLEYQLRHKYEHMAPHFHLIVYGVDWIDRDWLARAWYEVVNSGDPRHLRAGTSIERAKQAGAVGRYLSKYISKAQVLGDRKDDGFDYEHVGRWWGVRYPECIPWGELMRVALTDREAVRVLRFFRRFVEHRLKARKRRRRCKVVYSPENAPAEAQGPPGRKSRAIRSRVLYMDAERFWDAFPALAS